MAYYLKTRRRVINVFDQCKDNRTKIQLYIRHLCIIYQVELIHLCQHNLQMFHLLKK